MLIPYFVFVLFLRFFLYLLLRFSSLSFPSFLLSSLFVSLPLPLLLFVLIPYSVFLLLTSIRPSRLPSIHHSSLSLSPRLFNPPFSSFSFFTPILPFSSSFLLLSLSFFFSALPFSLPPSSSSLSFQSSRIPSLHRPPFSLPLFSFLFSFLIPLSLSPSPSPPPLFSSAASPHISSFFRSSSLLPVSLFLPSFSSSLLTLFAPHVSSFFRSLPFIKTSPVLLFSPFRLSLLPYPSPLPLPLS